MNLGKCFYFFCWGLLAMTGCASAGDTPSHSLTRQQSATIESLQGEVQRLNQELDGTALLREDLQGVRPKVEEMLAPQIARGDVRVVLDSRGLVVTVLDHAIFDPDETQMTSSGEELLEKISGVLSRELPKNRVIVEGHTDDQSIEGADGITNWEYSIGRATAVLHYFLDVKGLAPGRFGVSGYAEFRPIDSNATEAGRDRNRRVEIVIEPRKVSDAPGR
jgi:chemotaxis protein MotB